MAVTTFDAFSRRPLLGGAAAGLAGVGAVLGATALAVNAYARRAEKAHPPVGPIVLGHSFGTLVAVEYGLAYPSEVAGLVLESGYYFPTRRMDAALFAAPAIPVLGALLRHTVSPAISAMLLPQLIAKSFAPNPV